MAKKFWRSEEMTLQYISYSTVLMIAVWLLSKWKSEKMIGERWPNLPLLLSHDLLMCEVVEWGRRLYWQGALNHWRVWPLHKVVAWIPVWFKVSTSWESFYAHRPIENSKAEFLLVRAVFSFSPLTHQSHYSKIRISCLEYLSKRQSCLINDYVRITFGYSELNCI